MSPTSPDLPPEVQRLVDEGLTVRIEHGGLIVENVAVLTGNGDGMWVDRGRLRLPLAFENGSLVRSNRHEAHWQGPTPLGLDQEPLDFVQATGRQPVAKGFVGTHFMCLKGRHREFFDVHEQYHAYAVRLSAPAYALEPDLARDSQGGSAAVVEDGGVHLYPDTNLERAGIAGLAHRIDETVAIVGMGGTGSYLLDLVSKCPAVAIHVFDPDRFEQHNAFRSPGAPSRDAFSRSVAKVDHMAAIYSNMHSRIVSHPVAIGRDNLRLLREMDFVFLAIDAGEPRRIIADYLVKRRIDFVDCGIGVDFDRNGGGLMGLVRITSSSERARGLAKAGDRLPVDGPAVDDGYRSNIQIAELNALAAALAVVRWKRLRGFYRDDGREHHALYSVTANVMINDDVPT